MPSAERTPDEKFEINSDSYLKDGCYLGRRRLLLHCRTHGGAGARSPSKGQSDERDGGDLHGAPDGEKSERLEKGVGCKIGGKRRAIEDERKTEGRGSEKIQKSSENRSRDRAKKPRLLEDLKNSENKPSSLCWNGDLNLQSMGEESPMAGNVDRDNCRDRRHNSGDHGHRRHDARSSRRRESGRGGVRRVRVLYSRQVNMADLCRGGAVGPPFDSAESLADMMFGGSASGTEVLSATAYCSVIAVGTFLVRDVAGRRSDETQRSGRRRTRRRDENERSDSRSPCSARRRRDENPGASDTLSGVSEGGMERGGTRRSGGGDEESGMQLGRVDVEDSAEEAASVGKLGDGENSVTSAGSTKKEPESRTDRMDMQFGDRGGDVYGISDRGSEGTENDETVETTGDVGEGDESDTDGGAANIERSPSVLEAAEILSGRFTAVKKEEDAGGGGGREVQLPLKKKSIWSAGETNVEECCRLIVPMWDNETGRAVSTKGPYSSGMRGALEYGPYLVGAGYGSGEHGEEESDEEAEYIRTAR